MKLLGYLGAIWVILCFLHSIPADAVDLVHNGSFENKLSSWTAWGAEAALIQAVSTQSHTGKNCAQIKAGRNALYTSFAMEGKKAYQIQFFYKISGKNPRGTLTFGYFRENGGFKSAGSHEFIIPPAPEPGDTGWLQMRQIVVPSAVTVKCQLVFNAVGSDTVLWVDDVSVKEVPRPAGYRELPDPWEGLKHRTANPLFTELLTSKPGGYTMVTWTHNLNRELLPKDRADEFSENNKWYAEIDRMFEETGRVKLGFLDLPGRIDGSEPWRTAEYHRNINRKYGVKYDVWTEGSESISNGLKNGAELLNPAANDRGARPVVSWVDPKYVDAQEKHLVKLANLLKGEPFVGVYYGKDEPSIHLPEGSPEQWGDYSKAMAKEVLEKYGFGKYTLPRPGDAVFEKDPDKPLRWIAYHRWVADKWIETRCRLYSALHQADPTAVYSPADYWFMSGFNPFDFPGIAPCTDLFEIDPYASSAERRRGRGVYNHGFGPKFISDLTGKPVRVIAQAFDYAGYEMNPEDLREWVSQSMRCGASAISYYTMDNPRFNDPERWKMMLHISRVITGMNQINIPTDPDTAVIYASYTHMSHGASTGADQIYGAHVLIGEMAGSWYRFITDTQLEKDERELKDFRVVYLPLGKYMTPRAIAKLEAYVREGGLLVCGDAEAFSRDITGKDLSAYRERILGIGPAVPRQADSIFIQSKGQNTKTRLPLFPIRFGDEESPGWAQNIRITDSKAEVLGTYPDGKPSVISRKLGKGRVIVFAANPFMAQLAVEKTAWPAFFKKLQKENGCKVDRPIWRFCLPPMPE